MKDSKPNLARIDRRRFLELAGVGIGAATVVGVGIVTMNKGDSDSSDASASSDALSLTSVPVRNPAFKAMASHRPRHVVLYCRMTGEDFLAYELNARGYEIWRSCVSHDEFTDGGRKTLSQVATAVDRRLDSGQDGHSTTRDFVSQMLATGLVFLADGDAHIYFLYQEAC